MFVLVVSLQICISARCCRFRYLFSFIEILMKDRKCAAFEFYSFSEFSMFKFRFSFSLSRCLCVLHCLLKSQSKGCICSFFGFAPDIVRIIHCFFFAKCLDFFLYNAILLVGRVYQHYNSIDNIRDFVLITNGSYI